MTAAHARILIVDDDETVLRTFAKALSLEGYDVRTAASPLVGLEEAEQSAPDAILLDLRMPFVNGFGFLYRLRALGAHRHTPVAIITGDSCIDDPALNELHDLEAEVLFKPIWLEEVLSVTRSLLARRRPQDPKPS
jgi:DNA-binding response OmpR family regulator